MDRNYISELLFSSIASLTATVASLTATELLNRFSSAYTNTDADI